MEGPVSVHHDVPVDILKDLGDRFLNISLETEKLLLAHNWSEVWDTWVEVCTMLQNAYWHYIDNCLTAEEKLKLGDSGDPNSKQKYPFKQFCAQIFPTVSCLSLHLCSLEKILIKFRKWKGCQPACGVILLNPSLDKVLLVQEFGNKNWGFPKGKCEGNESPESCAAREVFEEVGIDVVKMIDSQEWFERKIGTKVRTLFIIPNPVAPQGIPEDTEFKTKTKGEIGDIRWFSLKDTFMPAKFFTVRPFIRDVRRWVPDFRKQQASYIQVWQKKNHSILKTDGRGTKAEEKVDLQVGVETLTKVQTKIPHQNLQVKKCELPELGQDLNKFKITENKAERDDTLPRKARPKSRGV